MNCFYGPLMLCFVFLPLLFGYCLTLDGTSLELMLAEGGPIESASAIGYFVCAAYILYRGSRRYLTSRLYFPLLCIFFGLRELDFDKRFTSVGLLKSKFYLSSLPSTGEKIVGYLLVAVLLYVLSSLLKNHVFVWKRDFEAYGRVYIGSVIAFALIAISKTVDGLPRKLRPLGINMRQSMSDNLHILEEVLELGIPIVIFITIVTYFSIYEKKGSPISIGEVAKPCEATLS